MDEKEQDRICLIIENDDFPQNKIYFSENFHYVGRQYSAIGYVVVEGKGYSFSWDQEWGIRENSIEEDEDAFKYINLKDIKKEFQIDCNICGENLLVKYHTRTTKWNEKVRITILYCANGCGECEL